MLKQKMGVKEPEETETKPGEKLKFGSPAWRAKYDKKKKGSTVDPDSDEMTLPKGGM